MSEARADFTADRRRQVVGMSELGALLGLSSFKSPADLALEKMGKRPTGDDITPTTTNEFAPMYFGNKFEPTIAECFQDWWHERNPDDVVKVRKDGREYADDDTRTTCHLDYRIEGRPHAVECKASGSTFVDGWGQPMTDEIPEYYLVQCHGQMWRVKSLERVYVPRLVNFALTVYVVERNDAYFDLFDERIREFWQYVDRGEIPPIDWTHRTARQTIETIYPGVDGSVVEFGPDELALTTSYRAMSDRRKECADAADAIKNELQYRMGEAACALLPDGTCWRRQRTKRAGYTVEPSEYLDFRHLKKPPKGVVE